MTFRAGDTVFYRPLGEKWILAYADDGNVSACGWPESINKAADCDLVEAATDEGHVAMLHEWADVDRRRDSGGLDHRTSVCRRQLADLADALRAGR